MTCLSFLCGRKVDPTTRPSGFQDELSGVHNVNLYSYRELRLATDDFSPENKVGEGGFGCVYKGKLKNGQVAAIKVLSSHSRQGIREFLTEIQVITDIEHENLVKLYGCCVEGNHRILVYNYLENNSLARTLLGGSQSGIYFNWPTRVKICIGIASGLAYLHKEVRPHIIHRDIKASNILLDKDLTPKISDFGLAKLIPPNVTHVSTRVAGTVGYLAPEYAITGQVTRRVDIYSFGILLIEIVSGRSNNNTRLPMDEQYILERTWQLYERNELVLLVDATLNGDFDAEQACRFLKIGLLCTQDSPMLRPSMSTVVEILSGKKDFDESTITKPGLITDFRDLKIKSNPKPQHHLYHTSSNQNSSGSDTLDNMTSTSPSSSRATMTFTAICDRSG
ncbi:putative serine/threonine-protein kinase [Sesamum indicum]|uniref:Serine/threonine-protein kinase n=1 Tax=Sesamum indicum TaxID=4182 RepID=A0A6I9UCP9_SESIN|nr:putative serine/threonine-protein kinase [Sesamum indicum]XP_011095672.1 putative serine/threonine-protein kinase [Sesamum indicum]XP_011095673.1 putative serine/threonine-protein kinase [Sesamum indicum]